jgi:putative ABC transport system permease protein
MILFNLKIAWRNIIKNRTFSAINVTGLALSMACCLVIATYVWSELRHDTFHKNAANIYRITEKQNQAGTIYNVAVTPGPLAEELKKDFPEVINTVRFGSWGGVVKNGTNIMRENKMLLTDNSVFSAFDFPLIKGNPKTALNSPSDIVITENTAKRFFGNKWKENPALIGQRFTLNDEADFVLAGVTVNPPENSSIQFEILLPLQYLFATDKWSNKWQSNNFHTYLQLKPGTDVAAFGKKIEKQLHVYNPDTEDLMYLQPLKSQYLHSAFDFGTDWGKRSSFTYIKIFSGVGILLLIIACVNFVNLSTSRSLKRSMEVGVRKVNGASRNQLIFQFLTESIVMSAIAGILAIVLINLFSPFLKTYTGTGMFFSLAHPLTVPFFIATIVIIGIIAGLYPAFFLSRFNPIKVFKHSRSMSSGKRFRQALVTLQFTISVTLITCTWIMYNQLEFVRNKDLGFDKDQLISIRLSRNLKDKAATFKQEVEKLPGVVAATASTMTLVNVGNSSYLEWDGMQESDKFLITQANIDPDFIPALGMQMINGDNFSKQKSTDTSQYIVNEATVKRLGMNVSEIIGKEYTFWGAKGKVIGVVQDFHFKPLKTGIEPFIFRYQPKEFYFNVIVKIAPGKSSDAISSIEKIYKTMEPEFPLEYSFINESLNELYREDEKTAGIILLFAVLTIFVGCLGLFGLTVFATEQRIKEIGIRKVLGAGVSSIVTLISSDFLKLIVLATLIAIPVGLYFIQKWLQEFAFRIDVQWWFFAGVGMMVLIVALITISAHAVKAAMANPTESLRSE